MRLWALGFLASFLACTTPAVSPAPDASDAAIGTIHTYTCPLDGGLAWTCSDGLNSPVGSCPSYCVPIH
jgi:hypothetical protein